MKTICINIDQNVTDWELTKSECDRVGIQVERMSAVTGENGPLAFNRSVLKAMNSCLIWKEGDESEYETLLLLEDDCVFESGITAEFLSNICRNELPFDFMTLHFGANITGGNWDMPEPYSDNLVRLPNAWMTHCVLYSPEAIRFIVNNLDPDRMDAENCIFDEWMRKNIMPMGKSFLMNPMVAYQRPRHSGIWSKHADYTGIHKSGNEWLKNNL